MFCAWCTEQTAAAPCSGCGHEPLLEGRYRLEHPLGRGASGVTWAATRLEDGELVAVKAVPMPPGLPDKERELVAREVEVLRQLDHPAVPSLLDAFTVRGGAGVRVQYLVQEFVAGQTLDQQLADHRFDEDEVLGILEEVLPILGYLHRLSPPVVHRDLKPNNLMRRADGALVLIDFGAVKGALSDPQLGGSTVAGTFGYMAPEQFAGDACPRSDLYALGATAVALLARQEPRRLLEGGRLAWRDRVRVSAPTAALLEDLLAVDPEDRPADAGEVLRRIRAIRRPERAAPEPQVSGPSTASWSDEPPLPRWAEQGGSAGVLLVAGGAVLVVVVLGGLLGGRYKESPTARAEDPWCASGPCQPADAFAIRGLRLGQTRTEAEAAFPELADAELAEPVVVRPSIAILDPERILDVVHHTATLPGEVLAVRTAIAEALARCELAFAIDDRLSRVSCEVEPGDAPLRPVAERIVGVLTDRHGPPDVHVPSTSIGWEGSWRWSDGSGEIALRGKDSTLAGMRLAELTLEAETAAHRRLVEAAEARARRAADAAAREAAREREAARRRELEALRQRTGDPTGGL